jgi:hypothetical protein
MDYECIFNYTFLGNLNKETVLDIVKILSPSSFMSTLYMPTILLRKPKLPVELELKKAAP